MRAGPVAVAMALCGYVFLLAPIAVVLALSLSSDPFLRFPPTGWSTRWFVALVGNAEIMAAARTSALLATVVTVLALAAGVPAAFAVARGRVPGAIGGLLSAPLMMPSLVLGLALLMALHPLRLVATWPGLVLAHLVIVLPFVVRIMVAALGGMAIAPERAAASLGASPRQVFLRVTLPLALPGVLAAATLAFLVSFDETVMSLFLTGPRLTTLPVAMFRYTESRTDPLIAALAVSLIGLSGVIVLGVERLVGFSRVVGKTRF